MIREKPYHNLYISLTITKTSVAWLSLVDVVRSGSPLINENPCFIYYKAVLRYIG